MKILIGADFVPTKSNVELFKSGAAQALIGEELFSVLQNAQYRIFNLEVPLTDICTPIEKCGPALIASKATVAGYKAVGVDLLTLANNHIMDQNVQGLRSTVKTLDGNGIAHVGSGNTRQQAKEPYVFELDDKKIGLYACAEHEFSIAGENMPGANPFDPLESLDHIAALKKQCDYVIVLHHGGKEHYRYPSPNLQKVCRKMVEKGADLVICQHTHCIGCEEKYLGGTIVYGQGNFLFDLSESECWQTGLLVQVNDNFDITYIPLVKQGNGVRLADDNEGKKILDAFYGRSAEIAQDGFVENQYIKFAREMLDQYLFTLSGIHRGLVYRVVNKLLCHRLEPWLLKRKYDVARKRAARNYIECEAHRELLLTGLKHQ